MKINFVDDILGDPCEYGADGVFRRRDLPPGSAQWSTGSPPEGQPDPPVVALLFVCPCGCSEVVSIPVAGPHQPHPPAHPGWRWDGNTVLPTLSPSIRLLERCKWHGHLVAGEWRTC